MDLTTSRRGRSARDPLTDAIATLAALPQAEWAAAQACIEAMRTLAAARSGQSLPRMTTATDQDAE